MTEPDLDRMVFHEVDEERWADLEQLFEARGGPKHCWCMVWRAQGEETKHRDGRSLKAALKHRVDDGVPIGILGYLDGAPVAWCSVAPRSTYRSLGGPEDEDGEKVWSLVCLFIPRSLRGHGATRRLIEAAAATAKRHGATVLEAYPVDPESPSYRFMGFVPSFAKAGFDEGGRAGTRRHVMRREPR